MDSHYLHYLVYQFLLIHHLHRLPLQFNYPLLTFRVHLMLRFFILSFYTQVKPKNWLIIQKILYKKLSRIHWLSIHERVWKYIITFD